MPASPSSTTLSRLVANRFGYGWTPALEAEMRRVGGARAWFGTQLQPPADPFFEASRGWWPANGLGPVQLWQRHQAGTETLFGAGTSYQRWVLARRIFGRAQVLEVVQEFWEHHLHVPATGGSAEMAFRAAYGDTIRAHALGRFDQMLCAAVTHPAMGLYLDNAVSTAKAPNENLGRELLELHTVGRDAYTEADVKAAARILTGWRVDARRTWSTAYDPDSHATGWASVLGFSDPNTSRDGRDLTRRFLVHLARHPATAQRIARKLAVQFVTDSPTQAYVDRLAAVYLAHGTAVVPVLEAIVDSAEFRSSQGAKLRTPDAEVVAAYRALGVRYGRPSTTRAAADAVLYQTRDLGHAPFSWQRPDGRPADSAAWSGTARLLASFGLHWQLAGGYWPKEQATYRRPASWLPARTVTLARLVDHLSRSLTGRPADATLRRACSLAVDTPLRARITARHPVIWHRSARLLATVLDSRAFLTT